MVQSFWKHHLLSQKDASWPAPGSEDTELGVFMGPEDQRNRWIAMLRLTHSSASDLRGLAVASRGNQGPRSASGQTEDLPCFCY
jgi:hypothetical protein